MTKVKPHTYIQRRYTLCREHDHTLIQILAIQHLREALMRVVNLRDCEK